MAHNDLYIVDNSTERQSVKEYWQKSIILICTNHVI